MPTRRIVNIVTSLICMLILLGVTIYLIVVWPKLPAQIPTNYDFNGGITGYGGKGTVIVQLVFAWLVLVLLTAMAARPLEKGGALRFAHVNALRIGKRGRGDFTREAMKKNPVAANNIGIDMLVSLKFSMTVLFSVSILASLRAAAEPVWFFPVMMALIFVPVAVHLVRLWRIAKQ